jgi:hypothetical protein
MQAFSPLMTAAHSGKTLVFVLQIQSVCGHHHRAWETDPAGELILRGRNAHSTRLIEKKRIIFCCANANQINDSMGG